MHRHYKCFLWNKLFPVRLSLWFFSGNNPEMSWLYHSVPWTPALLVSFSEQMCEVHSGTAAFMCYSARVLNWADFSSAAFFSKALKKFKKYFLFSFWLLENCRIVWMYTFMFHCGMNWDEWTGLFDHHGRLNVHKSLPCSVWENTLTNG